DVVVGAHAQRGLALERVLELLHDVHDLLAADAAHGRHGQAELLHFLGAHVLEHLGGVGLAQRKQQHRGALHAVELGRETRLLHFPTTPSRPGRPAWSRRARPRARCAGGPRRNPRAGPSAWAPAVRSWRCPRPAPASPRRRPAARPPPSAARSPPSSAPAGRRSGGCSGAARRTAGPAPPPLPPAGAGRRARAGPPTTSAPRPPAGRRARTGR